MSDCMDYWLQETECTLIMRAWKSPGLRLNITVRKGAILISLRDGLVSLNGPKLPLSSEPQDACGGTRKAGPSLHALKISRRI